MTLNIESAINPGMERRTGRLDRYYIRDFTELSSPDLAHQAHRVHGEGYVNEGFVKRWALNEAGTLPADIDKARGANVDYYLSTGWDVDSKNSLTTEWATMRKINIPENGTLDDLPAYQLCQDYLDPVYREYLESLEQPAESVKEIAALARTENASPLAVFELLRDSLQDARDHNEIWFFSIVSRTYDSLADNFGTTAIRRIGSPVMFHDERINSDVSLIPALVHTHEFVDDIRRTLEQTDDLRKKKQLTRSFMFFTEGLADHTLTEESKELRDYVQTLLRRKLDRR